MDEPLSYNVLIVMRAALVLCVGCCQDDDSKSDDVEEVKPEDLTAALGTVWFLDTLRPQVPKKHVPFQLVLACAWRADVAVWRVPRVVPMLAGCGQKARGGGPQEGCQGWWVSKNPLEPQNISDCSEEFGMVRSTGTVGRVLGLVNALGEPLFGWF